MNCLGGFCGHTDASDVWNDVDIELLEEELRMFYHFKVLVLGAGESGKSTVVKQLRFIHKSDKLNDKERERIRSTLAENTTDCLRSMCEACGTFEIEFDDEEDAKIAESLMDEDYEINYDEPFAAGLSKLWRSAAIQEVYQFRDKFWLLDSCEYFMENIERFAEEDFVLSEEDVVMARIRTTGIITTEFDQRNADSKADYDKLIQYQVIDVGGQRAERKKWMHCFDDVKAILFVVNMAGYNMVLFEDDTKNRMHEALELFSETVNKPIFANTPIFLFLNKKDLFEVKLKEQDLNACFEEYKDGPSLQSSLNFITQKFRDEMPEGNVHQFRDFYIASRLKRDVKYAFEDLQADLLNMNKDRLEQGTKRVLKQLKKHKR